MLKFCHFTVLGVRETVYHRLTLLKTNVFPESHNPTRSMACFVFLPREINLSRTETTNTYMYRLIHELHNQNSVHVLTF